MKKRIVALLLCCVMLLTLSPSLIASASADDENTVIEQTEEPKNEEPKTEEPKTEEPKTEEPKTEEPKTEEPKNEEPKAEEPKTEEPKTEEPKTEEPAAETEPETKVEEPVESEIVYPTVNYTDVAPFLPPVSGRPMLRAARAAANDATGDAGEKDSGMKTSKTATANRDGTYTITLEAYATGEQVVTEITEDVPTDIILVLDQSGSMKDAIGTVTYTKYEDESGWVGTTYHTRNQDYYDYRHNGGSANLWYKLPDGSYVSVSVTAQEEMSYTALGNLVNYETSWGRLTTDCYYYYANNLYEKVGNEYKKVTVSYSQSGEWWNYTDNYTYTFSDGTTVTSSGDDSQPDLGSHAPLYYGTADEANTVYTYTYTGKDGNVQTIGTSKGASIKSGYVFYQRGVSSSGGGSRLEALKSAVSSFVSAVNTKAKGTDGVFGTGDDINHRIAVVGFASKSGNGNNTELLSIAGRNSGSVGVAYNNISNQNLKDVMQSMNTTAGQTMVTNAINALAANGATRADLGLDMANRILNANPVPTNEKRNRVVIVFTDGSPTDSNGFELDVANDAITKANTIKNSGTTVYSIGIFSGADATSAGTKPSRDLGQNSSQLSAACNWFMQQVSSNNGTPRYPSYYLSAGDAASLNSIFQQISSNITTGGTTSTLTSDAVVKDIISPQFTLPEGATASSITLETYRCTGKNGSDYTWSKNADAMGAKASISGDQVNVTGFNFSENYVGTVTEGNSVTYRGHKLVISFKVQPKAGFLGGNDVPTNTNAGIYENGSAQNPVITFERPTVNVPIEDVTVTAADKNVYLLSDLTAEQLKDGAEISVGDVKLDLSKATDTDKPYGLDPWQTEYVDITVTVKDKDGNPISDKLDNLTEDTTYTVEVTVAPKTVGTSTAEKGDAATAKTGTSEKSINVFKPELTFQDSVAYYGDNAPVYSTTNKVGEVWKHGETVSTNVTMLLDTAPELDISYTSENGKIVDGKINTKNDIKVAATVKIGDTPVNQYTTFVHQDCTTACGWETPTTPGAPAFLIHIQTCQLTITKTGGKDGEPYVFDVYKDGNKYTEVTIVGNGTEAIVELPVGKYTIQENTAWSWRYNANNGSEAELSAANPNDSITCINSSNGKIYWLNGFSTVVTNTFRKSN